MNIRQNDILANLPPEDRAKLNYWLQNHSYRRVLEFAAAPRPDGLGLKTNLRALSRYFNKFLAPNPLEAFADLALHNPEGAEAAACNLIRTKALNGAIVGLAGGPFDVRLFNSLLRFHEQIQRKSRTSEFLNFKTKLAELRNRNPTAP
jgi:hypothetical protein